MTLVILEVLPRSREEVKAKKSWLACYIPLVEICSCSCPPFQDKWIQHKDQLLREKKKIVKLLLQLRQQGWELCTFCEVHFLSHVENTSFMWVQDCCKEIIPIGFNMIWEERLNWTELNWKSSYDILKQKEGERSKAVEFNASKRLFDKFQKRFDLKKCQDNRRSCFCRPRSSLWVPQCH